MIVMNEYRFSIGDSRRGPLGLCFSVYATSTRDAVCLARRVLVHNADGHELVYPLRDSEGIKLGYFGVLYFNPKTSVTRKNIVDVTEAGK